MSDSKKVPGMPPDDFDKTTPNIPRPDSGGSSDWEKTNYNARFKPQPQADDWGKTVSNIPPIKNEPDFNKTHLPSNSPKTPDWGVTEQNIRLPQDDFGGGRNEAAGDRTNYGATSPFIQLPEAERQKYQNLPPTPTQRADKEKEEAKEKGGIPGWFWASLALLGMFFVALVGIAAAYFIFLRPSGFDLVVLNPQPGSKVIVDGIEWSVTEGDGSLIARGLKSDEIKKIDIKAPGFVCESREVKGSDGETIRIPARCTPAATGGDKTTPPDECKNIKNGEFEKAQRCANQALDNLKEPYSAEDIAAALNLYIINFAVNKFNVPDKDMIFLEKASKYLKKLPETTQIEVGGHTDSDGTDDKNQKLSENRAKSVRDALVGKYGVNPNMLTEKGYGESRPKPGNQNRNPDEKFQNRRIEYSVLKK
ncbi:MAG: OmpA family protein [Acidobacteria bacterium]|nr:OmpA family protein [Acidobacteriota bacterium]MBK8810539.1 OmpA family protein [Acidobacteriota bacterium]